MSEEECASRVDVLLDGCESTQLMEKGRAFLEAYNRLKSSVAEPAVKNDEEIVREAVQVLLNCNFTTLEEEDDELFEGLVKEYNLSKEKFFLQEIGANGEEEAFLTLIEKSVLLGKHSRGRQYTDVRLVTTDGEAERLRTTVPTLSPAGKSRYFKIMYGASTV